MQSYLRYAISGKFAKTQLGNPTVPRPRDCKFRTADESLRAATAALTEKIFWFTTLEAIRQDGFWSPIWWRPKDGTRSPLLETAHEVLLQLQPNNGGRADLLQLLRAQLRREDSARRHHPIRGTPRRVPSAAAGTSRRRSLRSRLGSHFEFLLSLLPGLILAVVSVARCCSLHQGNGAAVRSCLPRLILLLVASGFLWWVWSLIPAWFRKTISIWSVAAASATGEDRATLVPGQTDSEFTEVGFGGVPRNGKDFLALKAPSPGQCCPQHCPDIPLGDGACAELSVSRSRSAEVAELIGVSSWTVRQRYLQPRTAAPSARPQRKADLLQEPSHSLAALGAAERRKEPMSLWKRGKVYWS